MKRIFFAICCLVFVAVARLSSVGQAFMPRLFGAMNRTATENEYLQIPAVIHVHSDFSDGKHPIEEIARLALEKEIKVLIFSDHALMRWEYGLWPLQNVLKKRVEKNSVLKFGINKYFTEIKKVQEKYPNLLLVAGVETAPFYYWRGKHFKYHLTIHDWHKHLLVTGLGNPEDYQHLPLVSNPNAGVWDLRSIVLFWPILLLAIGSWLVAKKRKRQLVFGQQVFIAQSSAYKVLGIAVILIGLLFLINNYPYKYFPYDQYHGDKSIMPYQDLINYIKNKNGVIFWAHPEAPNWEKPQEIEGITLQTLTYEEDLLKTRDYTGFAILYEGYKKVGIPGGIWDKILHQYCQGLREKPIWAIGELDYKSEGYLGTYLDSIQNILLIPTNLHKSEQGSQDTPFGDTSIGANAPLASRRNVGSVTPRGESDYFPRTPPNLRRIENPMLRINTNIKTVLDCLRKGKFYVLQKAKNSKLILEKFEIESEMGKATISEEIKCSDFSKIKIKIDNESTEKLPLKINLIRGGNIIKIFEQNLPVNIEYIDYDLPTGKTYYRLEISGAGCGILTNPIFVIK